MTTIDDWLAAVRADLLEPHAHRAELAELVDALREAADELGEQAACEAFGDPAEVARQLNQQTPTEPAGANRLVGSPVGVNPITMPSRLASAFDPADSRILVPHALGLGWQVNLGAVATRLHLVEPDQLDEDVLDALDEQTLTRGAVAASIPALLGLALLPFGIGQERLPNHWPLFGPPDGWVTPITGQWLPILLTLGAIGLAFLPRRLGASQLWRMLLLVIASMLSVTMAGVIGMQVFGGSRPIGWLLLPVMLAATGAALAQGVVLLRAGARAAARTHEPSQNRS
ncbi:hypothetical protein AAEX63_03580 [Luteococcus sp. H138]|uniref:hypothetical protein n=1 Tax=unclassified Luteococcus TaxID=2639923 RepID=UPI00313EB22F